MQWLLPDSAKVPEMVLTRQAKHLTSKVSLKIRAAALLPKQPRPVAALCSYLMADLIITLSLSLG